MRGRKPKPIEKQIAEGDPRKHGVGKLQEKLDRQVQALRGLPACPKYMDGVAREAWRFWKRELESMQLDYRPDRMMLEGACFNYARALQAEAEIKAKGVTVIEPILDSEGNKIGEKIRKNPAVEVANQAWRLARGFCSEFGLSPVARLRLVIEKDGGDDLPDLNDILNGPRVAKTSFR